MSARTYRLRITPERVPDVHRVLDLDGRHTLHDLHLAIQREFRLDDDHLYAFFLSGRYWDRATQIGSEARHDQQGASRSLLCRLGLEPGKTFAYVFDFGDELRHRVDVVAVTESASPLVAPMVVESVGDAPPQYADFDSSGGGDWETSDDLPDSPGLAHLIPAATRLAGLLTPVEREQRSPTDLLDAHSVVIALVGELGSDAERFFDLEEASGYDLLGLLLDLPFALAAAGNLDEAAEIGKALSFVDRENFLADRAVILAEAGRAEAALDQAAANLDTMGHDPWVRIKAGDVHRALGNSDRAERLYREVLAATASSGDREGAVERLEGLLRAGGRTNEADALLAAERATKAEERRRAEPVAAARTALPKVGRNDPCPCGSGKKHKKCCG